MSRRCPIRDGKPLKNQTCEQGLASSICPSRSRRTFDCVTSTPHLSQITPRCFILLYFPHKTFPIRNRTENAGAEQTVALRFEGAVINRFGFGNFAVRPRTDFFRRRKADTNRFKIRIQLVFRIFISELNHKKYLRYLVFGFWLLDFGDCNLIEISNSPNRPKTKDLKLINLPQLRRHR